MGGGWVVGAVGRPTQEAGHGLVCLVAKSCLSLWDPWNVACQAPLSMRFPRQKYWSGLPFPSPGDLPAPGLKPEAPVLQAASLLLSRLGTEPFPSVVTCGVNPS